MIVDYVFHPNSSVQNEYQECLNFFFEVVDLNDLIHHYNWSVIHFLVYYHSYDSHYLDDYLYRLCCFDYVCF